MDHHYIHYKHAPTVSPLSQPLQIEAYNQEWFNQKPSLPLPLAPVTAPNPTVSIDNIAFQPHIPTIAELNDEGHPDQLFESTVSSPYSPPIIDDTTTTENTLRPKWFLVQVDLELTATNDTFFKQTGTYVCSFLARHPSDLNKTDERSR